MHISNWPAYLKLMRADRPIGTYLLLWPTLSALWIAAEGFPPMSLVLIFCLGVFLTRAGGCVINDYFDRDFDGHVARTKDRPIPAGNVSEKEAFILASVLFLLASTLLLFLNWKSAVIALIAFLLAISYPLMKRMHHLPQLMLGLAFSMGIFMAFTATQNLWPPAIAWALFGINVIWTVAYDTIYAMGDQPDDERIGLKSSAILFGDKALFIVNLLQALVVVGWILAGLRLGMPLLYYLGPAIATALFVYQHRLTQQQQYLSAFLNNHWIGFVLFVCIAILSPFADALQSAP